MADEKQLEQLSAKVNAIEEGLSKLGETVANAVAEAVKPLKSHVDALDAANKAKEEAEKADLEAKVIKANILDEETAKATPVNTLRKLAEKAKPGQAAALNAAFGGTPDADPWAGYDLNANIDGKETK